MPKSTSSIENSSTSGGLLTSQSSDVTLNGGKAAGDLIRLSAKAEAEKNGKFKVNELSPDETSSAITSIDPYSESYMNVESSMDLIASVCADEITSDDLTGEFYFFFLISILL